MSLERLEQIVAPPLSPVAAHGDWSAVERALGTPLPSDWKALVEAYGYGSFCDFFHLQSPFFEPCTMIEQAKQTLDADRQLAKMFPKAVPFPSFPDADGALPWARTDNGDVAYWLTMGSPDDWPVAVWNPRGGERFELVDGGAVRFLAGWLGGEFAVSVFPKSADFRKERDVWFDAWRMRVGQTIQLATESETPEELEGTEYAWRLAALVAALQPVTMRGGYGDEDDESRQVHFVANDGAWRLTYDTVYGHNIRLAAPAEQLDAARAKVDEGVRAMGCRVTRVVTS